MNRDSDSSPIEAVRWLGRTAVVDAVGDIDLNTSLEFQRGLLEILDKNPRRLVVNLAGVPYMDSSGVASLVKLLSRARKRSMVLCLVGLAERVRSVFEITRLDTVFEIYATEQEALVV